MSNVTGGKELAADLKRLKERTPKQLTRIALRFGAKIIQKAAQDEAPRGPTGRLKGDIRVAAGSSKKDFVSVKVIAGKKAAFYAGFVDEGHYTGKRVRVSNKIKGRDARKAEYHRLSRAKGRTWIEGNHFMTKAFDATKDKATDAASAKLVELMDQVLH